MSQITDDDLREALAAVPTDTYPGQLERLTGAAILHGRTRRRRRRWATGAGAVLTATALAVTAVALDSAGTVRTPSTADPTPDATHPIAGASLLLSLAAHLQKLPDRTTDAPYWYVESIEHMSYPDWKPPDSWDRAWYGHHRRTVDQSSAWGTQQDVPWHYEVGDGTDLSWNQLAKLPTDATQLRAWLDQHDGPAPDGGKDQRSRVEAQFGIITNLLSASPASPALRAALYQVLADLPGAKARPGHDGRGRDALVVTWSDPTNDRVPGFTLPPGAKPTVENYYVSPSSGAMLETEIVNGDEKHDMYDTVTYLATGPVDDVHTKAPPLL